MIKNREELKRYIQSDLFRYTTSLSFSAFLRSWFIPGFRFSLFLRLCQYFSRNYKGPLFVLTFFILRHYQFKYGIAIHYSTRIGRGLYIGHFGGIVVNPQTVIGENVNLSPGVLLGHNYNKNSQRFEYPVVGDRVALCNNCKVLGGVKIGNDAVVGVSSVVTKDIPAMAIVVGAPAKVISEEGSSLMVGSILK